MTDKVEISKIEMDNLMSSFGVTVADRAAVLRGWFPPPVPRKIFLVDYSQGGFGNLQYATESNAERSRSSPDDKVVEFVEVLK